MAVYKVIQDIESEDKLLGPLTLKGLAYAMIAFACAFINFKLLFIASPIKYPVVFVLAMPMILFGVLASPLGREQPTEVWLLSRIRFFLKPRSRIWDQEGMSDLVTVNVPKKVEVNLTKNLSRDEVQSRLKTLATTLDTRGWAIKNVDVNLSVPEVEAKNAASTSDRLVGTAGMPNQMPVVDVHAADDILDEKNNPTAKKFDTMVKQADAKRKHGVLEALRGFVDDKEDEEPKKSHAKRQKKHVKKHGKEIQSTKDLPATKAALARAKQMSAAEKARKQAEWEAQIAEKLAKARVQFSSEFEQGRIKDNPAHHVVGPIKPPEQPKPPAAALVATPPQQVTPPPKLDTSQSDDRLLRSGFDTGQAPANQMTSMNQTDKMELAQSGSAFSVATLSQLANRQAGQTKVEQTGPDELTISLH